MLKTGITDRIVETDVLIIGGGVTGLWSSIKARGFVDRVTIVDKGPKDWGGQGFTIRRGYGRCGPAGQARRVPGRPGVLL